MNKRVSSQPHGVTEKSKRKVGVSQGNVHGFPQAEGGLNFDTAYTEATENTEKSKRKVGWSRGRRYLKKGPQSAHPRRAA